jgi:transposase
MNIHKNARTTPYSRAEILRRVMVLRETPRAVATALGVSQRTIAKWLARYRAEGEAGLAHRSSRPHAMPSATPADVVGQVIALRRQRLCGKQIARSLGLSCATVSRVLRKARLSRLTTRSRRRRSGGETSNMIPVRMAPNRMSRPGRESQKGLLCQALSTSHPGPEVRNIIRMGFP